jgi:hypothetical protein
MVDATSEEILASANRVKKQEVEDKKAGLEEMTAKKRAQVIAQIKAITEEKGGSKPSMTFIKGKLKGITDAPEEAINELISTFLKRRDVLSPKPTLGPEDLRPKLKRGGMVKSNKKPTKAGRLAKRGYGAARK